MKKFILGLAALLVALGIAFVFWAYPKYYKDVEALDYSHLVVQRRNIPDFENAYQVYRQAYAKLSDIEKLGEFDQSQDSNKIIEFLEQNKESIQLFDKGKNIPAVEVPDYKRIDDRLPYLKEWRALTKLHLLRMRLASQQKKWDDLIELYLQGNQFVEKIASNPENLIQYLVARACRGMLYQEFCSAKVYHHFSQAQLESLRDQLINDSLWREAFIHAYKGELEAQIHVVDHLIYEVAKEGANKKFKNAKTVLYLQNETRNASIKNTEEIISQVDKKIYDLKFPTGDAFAKGVKDKRWFFVRNPIGKTLIAMILPISEKAFKYKDISIATNRFEKTIIACSLYRLDKGSLPQKLSDLVPTYLNAVPEDPFDGKPLRYDVKKKVIYSISHNLVDDGGQIEEGKAFSGDWQSKDIVFRFQK